LKIGPAIIICIAYFDQIIRGLVCFDVFQPGLGCKTGLELTVYGQIEVKVDPPIARPPAAQSKSFRAGVAFPNIQPGGG
jgi:hypothetical protein